jgi:CRISPR-associated exonuclease Cas4
MTLTPSHIIEYLFCPRYTYFEYVLCVPQYEEKYYKVNKGRDVHEKKSKQNIDYTRQKIGVQSKLINQYLCNDYLRGEVDEVLFLLNGDMSALDYKYAEYKDIVYDTYKTQLYCYAVLIEHNFNKTVNKGYLVYTRSKNKLIEVEITKNNKEEIKTVCKEINKIIDKNYFPKSTKYKKRCLNCTYKNICVG